MLEKNKPPGGLNRGFTVFFARLCAKVYLSFVDVSRSYLFQREYDSVQFSFQSVTVLLSMLEDFVYQLIDCNDNVLKFTTWRE